MDGLSFLGRSPELSFLEQAHLSNKTEFIPIYGRRRVGESDLILHFIKNKPHLYFLGKQGTAQPQIKEFMQEAAQFHPRFSLQEKAMVYFICGGIPLYLKFFDPKLLLFKNLEKNLFDEFAPLFREPEFLLREELRELPKYYTVLMALASGSSTSTELAKQTAIEERKLYYYLQNLIDLGYVARRFPLLPKNLQRKATRFVLVDPLLRFWFRFVYPHTAYIVQMGAREAVKNLVKPYWEAYCGICFEELCREALGYLYQEKSLINPFRTGEYWDKQTQIDVVGYIEKEEISLGECKWGKVSSYKKLIAELKDKITKYPNHEGLRVEPYLFIQKKPARLELDAEVHGYELEDLYGLTKKQ